jgi:hypothetical protein
VNTYNGWKNRQTWNVSLWLNNDEGVYREAVSFMNKHPQSKHPYSLFIRASGRADYQTPDGIKWLSTRLDYPRLNEMMKELLN